jgi:hypothetical protein
MHVHSLEVEHAQERLLQQVAAACAFNHSTITHPHHLKVRPLYVRGALMALGSGLMVLWVTVACAECLLRRFTDCRAESQALIGRECDPGSYSLLLGRALSG